MTRHTADENVIVSLVFLPESTTNLQGKAFFEATIKRNRYQRVLGILSAAYKNIGG